MSRTSFREWLVPNIPFVLGVLLLAPRLWAFVEIAGSLLFWPWQFDYDEGINLNAGAQLAAGQNIYRHNGPDGFISAPYTPLLYILSVPLMWVEGPQLWNGRLISLLATLAIAALIFWIVKRLTGLWGAGIFAGALWLSFSPVIVWSTLFKQDMPALALGLGGLALALRSAEWTEAEGRRQKAEGSSISSHQPIRTPHYVAAVLFALAFYTKQSALAAAAATTLWLLVRDWRQGLRFALVLLALIPGFFLAANALLMGGLWEHVVTNHSTLPWRFGQIERTWGRLWEEYWPLILLGATALVFWIVGSGLWLGRRRDAGPKTGDENSRPIQNPQALPFVYLAVGSASAFVQMGYVSGNYNHALDLILPLCIVIGQIAGRTWRKQYRTPTTEYRLRGTKILATRYSLLATLLLAFAVQLFLYNAPRTWYRGGWPSRELHADMENLSRLVGNTHGDVYSEDATLLIRNGKRVLYDDPSTFVPLAEMGLWDDSAFNADIRNGRFPIILLQRGSGRMTAEAREAFEASYRLKFNSLINTYESVLDSPEPQFTLGCLFTRRETKPGLPDILFEDEVVLAGYSLGRGAAQSGVPPGGVLNVTLYWRTYEGLRRSYATYVHVVDERGERVAGQDNPRTGASQPTDKWLVTELTKDILAIPLPPDLSPGRYRLIAGMYHVEGGDIRPFLPKCEGQLYGSAVTLGWVEVKK